MTTILSTNRLLALVIALALLLSLGSLPLITGIDVLMAGERIELSSEGQSYHIRLMRVRSGVNGAGSALFKPDDFVVPLTEQESWGSSSQIESLRRALGAEEIETIPGLVVAGGPTPAGEPHRFRTALGEHLVEISVLAASRPDGWHRLRLSAVDETGKEILDAALLVEREGTVAVVAPLNDGGEALIVGVTPMESLPGLGIRIEELEKEGLTKPVVIEETRVMPIYPEMARREHFSGKVVIEAVIRTDGVPDALTVLEMPEGGEHLAGSAVEAISQWRYEPAVLKGRPVPVYFTIKVQYALR